MRRFRFSTCRSGSPYCSNETGRAYHGEWDICAACEDAENEAREAAEDARECEECGFPMREHLRTPKDGGIVVLCPDEAIR